MKTAMYRFYMRLMLIIVAFLVIISIILELYIIPVIVVPLAILGSYGLRSKVEGVVQDERNFRISEMASRRTIQLLGGVTGMGGALLVGISYFGLEELEPLGFAMAMFATALILSYLAFYSYYQRKFGEFSDEEPT